MGKKQIKTSETVLLFGLEPTIWAHDKPFIFRRSLQIYPPLRHLVGLMRIANNSGVDSQVLQKGTGRAATYAVFSARLDNYKYEDFPNKDLTLRGVETLAGVLGEVARRSSGVLLPPDEAMTQRLLELPVPKGYQAHIVADRDLPPQLSPEDQAFFATMRND